MKTKTQSHTFMYRKKCIVTHYVKCLIEDWQSNVKTHPNKNKCVWDLTKEGQHMSNLWSRLFKTDEEKERDRKKRLQNPHHVKSKRHWDWDTGYDATDINNTSNDDIIKRKDDKRQVTI